MTTTQAAVAAGPRASRLRSYVRLGKLDVYDYYLSVFVALSAAAAGTAGLDPAALPAVVLLLAGEVLLVASSVALDDITGFLDGSDLTNYGPDHPLRNKLRKPLVSGALTLRQARGFAAGTAAGAAVLWAAAVAVAPHRPTGTLVLMGVLYAGALQYSWGLKLSYHGFQESFLVAIGAGFVLAPHGLATGSWPQFLLVQAVLFGFGPLMFGVYSNTNDVDGDRAVGRPTVAARTSARGNARFVAALCVLECAVGVGASAAGIAPWWFPLVMLPATALRAVQYVTGFRRGDTMRARRLGFTTHRLATALLVTANLLLLVPGAAA
ncbi:1,4-dihydroxy-2-naphthoate prenyltransferase [Streptomyces sp. SW4]|nr:1,4-dihydroxy-2-naphthoate prenyltransferase [Streptomyces sp. SW4]